VTVHARGYRAYQGAFDGPPAWWVVFRTNVDVIARLRAMRVLQTLLIVFLSGVGILLYIQIGLGERVLKPRVLQTEDVEPLLAEGRSMLLAFLRVYYTLANIVVALLAVLVGSGMVSDDLRSRALTLTLVRPVRPIDYALGKSLVLPWFLLTRMALPGLLLWLLAASWQPVGRTQAFLAHASDVPGVIAACTLLAAGAYTGLTLLISSGTSRRGVAAGLCAAVLFGGLALRGIGMHVDGDLGEGLRLASLPTNALGPLLEAHWSSMAEFRRQGFMLERLPHAAAAAWLAAALFVLGLARTWLRARSVEVSE
jgi:hypothetical protein